MLILQHRREHFHRFNTARIVHRALQNSQLLCDRTGRLAERLQFKPRAGLLYPGPAAKLISDLSPAERPEQLVIVDGTWHQAKTLVRDIPALQSLPQYRLAPSAPSRFRIRLEPNETALSTVEATVAALRVLEPETVGLEGLLAAFETMVEAQLAHPGNRSGLRFKARRSRTVKNIPLALAGDLSNIVVAYGESLPGECGQGKVAGPPLSWVARRLGDNAEFACKLIPPKPLSAEFLGHLELTTADFEGALSLAAARERWAEFQQPGDVVAVLQPGTARLFSYLSATACLVLKAVDLEPLPSPTASPALGDSFHGPGRAARRLQQAIDLVGRWNALVRSRTA